MHQDHCQVISPLSVVSWLVVYDLFLTGTGPAGLASTHSPPRRLQTRPALPATITPATISGTPSLFLAVCTSTRVVSHPSRATGGTRWGPSTTPTDIPARRASLSAMRDPIPLVGCTLTIRSRSLWARQLQLTPSAGHAVHVFPSTAPLGGTGVFARHM